MINENKVENYKKFISEDEEIRDWFKVISNRKKVWNIELWLLEELKKICKRHNIWYYADWGTLLWAIRHDWFIPWDDDIDLVMFREDYEKFSKIAEKELPDYIKLWKYHEWFSKLVNINTTALWDDNRWDSDYLGWIWIDIFPIDYASKFMIINKIKNIVLLFLRMILDSQKSYRLIDRMKGWKFFLLKVSKFFFKRFDCLKLLQLYDKINKKVFFKWKDVYSAWFVYRYFPKNIYDKSHTVKFENTTINIPDWYDVYLRTSYGNYMKPVISQWWHHCRYSVDESYKNIIKWFDKSKTNEDNYNNCNSLFVI